MSAHYIGVIAEDQSDIDVVKALIRKIAPNADCTVKGVKAGGCGKLMGKCRQWALELKSKRCETLILIQDLDARKLSDLMRQLEAAVSPSPIGKYLITIPVREIEAWLLSDPQAIRSVFDLRTDIPRISNPEALDDPKRYLAELVRFRSGKSKRYLNTEHNQKLAVAVRLELIRTCKSFQPFERFIVDNFT